MQTVAAAFALGVVAMVAAGCALTVSTVDATTARTWFRAIVRTRPDRGLPLRAVNARTIAAVAKVLPGRPSGLRTMPATRALLALALFLPACAGMAGGSRLAAAPPLAPVAWQLVDELGIGAEVLLSPTRQIARFGAIVELPPDVVPVLVVLSNTGRRHADPIEIRGADIRLALGDGTSLAPLEPAAVASAFGGEPAPLIETFTERPGFRYEAPVTVGMLKLARGKMGDLLVALFYTPATLTIDTLWSVAKWAVQVARASHGGADARDRNARLARLDAVRLEAGEWAAAVLHFRVLADDRAGLEDGSIRVPASWTADAGAREAVVPLTPKPGEPEP